MRIVLVIACALAAIGCGGEPPTDASVSDGALDASGADAASLDGALADAGTLDGGALDAGSFDGGDGGSLDGGSRDGGSLDGGSLDGGSLDGGSLDAGPFDAGPFDAGPPDSGPFDSGPFDAGPFDAGPRDSGPADTGPPDAGGGDCISGATGTHAVRFRWTGSFSGDRATVVYERNQLPDTSRWRVTAASASIGYVPRFQDTFLGIGGLDLEGTAFIDVELSTVGLTSLRNVTIAIYGRSYATTTSGSFTWQTFRGTGALPSGSIANSTPYEWYGGNATSAFTTGDSGVLLRLRAGPPSGALIVNRVEICFDAGP